MTKLFTFFFVIFSFTLYGKATLASDTLHINYDQQKITERHFSPNFKASYNDESFDYQLKPHQKTTWENFKEWIYSIFKNLFNAADKSKSLNFIDLFFKVLAGLLVLLAIYMIAKALLNKEGRWIFGRNSQSKIIEYSSFEKNIHLADFKKLILEAIDNDQKKLAIRYYYLWLLQKMSDSKHIEWHPEKTSTQYSYEITNPNIREKFNYLSYVYNNIWYGDFEVTIPIFNKAKEAFDHMIQTL